MFLEKHKLTGVRIAVNQDLVIPWVPFDRVRAIYDRGFAHLIWARPERALFPTSRAAREPPPAIWGLRALLRWLKFFRAS